MISQIIFAGESSMPDEHDPQTQSQRQTPEHLSSADPLKGLKDGFDKLYNSPPYVGFRKHTNWFFSSKYGIIFVGAFIGIVAAILQNEGNPGNMGFCMACFERDIAGALGLHSAGPVQYLRPEILGIILGSFLASLVYREYRARTGSAPGVRFVLGFFTMIGALVFLGCPWRALLRLAGGDWNAIIGIAGLTAGVFIGTLFIKNGFNLGRTRKTFPAAGLIMPAIAIILLALVIWEPQWDDGETDSLGASISTPVLRESATGPGSMHPAVIVSFGIALFVGFFAQRTRFCTIGGIRDSIMIQDYHLLMGVIALVVAAFVTNLAFDQFSAGWDGQPASMPGKFYTWHFLGMVLAGLGFTLAGGCPGRQLILSGEGDADAAIFVLGMVAGAAFSHNFRLASSGAGPGDWGPAAVIIGIILMTIIGLTMRHRP